MLFFFLFLLQGENKVNSYLYLGLELTKIKFFYGEMQPSWLGTTPEGNPLLYFRTDQEMVSKKYHKAE